MKDIKGPESTITLRRPKLRYVGNIQGVLTELGRK